MVRTGRDYGSTNSFVVELYKIYEIIKHSGKLDTAMRAAGISNKRVELGA